MTKISTCLSDGSTLLPSNLLVQTYEYHHTAGVIIQQTRGMMATTEIQDTHKAHFEHVLGRTARRSMKISTRSTSVTSTMSARPVKIDRNVALTPENRSTVQGVTKPVLVRRVQPASCNLVLHRAIGTSGKLSELQPITI
jgi:hypothetical protein